MYSVPPGALPYTVGKTLFLPLLQGHVHAGFPSPAADFETRPVDLQSLLVRNEVATFLWQVRGWSCKDFGIFDGDVLVIDTSLDPKHGDIVIAMLDGEFTCKMYFDMRGVKKLVPGNPDFPEITFKEWQQPEIWGVVTASVKRFRGR